MLVRTKIEERMDVIEGMVKSKEHINNPDNISAAIATVTKFWSAMTESERDYINAIREQIAD